jgi:hypothetical protein
MLRLDTNWPYPIEAVAKLAWREDGRVEDLIGEGRKPDIML